ncbi:MAG: lipopolysaccharide heptosyltransferase II, partial [Acidobacteria bacterium]|nr:lipopolysaccharide heptosyltransferase II [Acidobacteriota bacterium]
MTIPALREIRRLFKQARITLWTKPDLRDLFTEVDFIDDVLLAPRASWRQTVAAIRSRSFDVAILFQNAFRPALEIYAARVPIRCGYRTDGRGFLLTHAIRLDPELKHQHQVFSYLNLVSAFGQALTGQTWVDLNSPNQILPLSDERRKEGLAFLAEQGVDLNKRLVVVNPGATNSRAKQWLPERFAAVADQLLARGDTNVVFIGANEEVPLAQQIAAPMRRQPILLTGQTTLRELVSILSCAQLLISNDTGPAHIGAAVGVPTLTIFGPTEHFATRPFSERATVIRQPVWCSPCMLRDCPIDHRCMT